MTRDIVMHQLEILRAQVDALAALVNQALPATPPAQPAVEVAGECQHPDEARVAAPGMGNPNRFYCGRCRKTAGGGL